MRQVLAQTKELTRLETLLARDELKSDLLQLKGAAIFGSIALVLAALTFSMLVVTVVLALGGSASLALLVAAALVLGGGTLAFLSYRSVPKQLLEHTRERLKNDMNQLKAHVVGPTLATLDTQSGTSQSIPEAAPRIGSTARDELTPPRIARRSERGERRPHASWKERLMNTGTLMKEAGQ